MSGTETLWSIPGAGAVAWALVSFLWQGALVALALAGALSLVPSRSPRLRYALAAGALFVMFVLPVGTATLTPLAPLSHPHSHRPGEGGKETKETKERKPFLSSGWAVAPLSRAAGVRVGEGTGVRVISRLTSMASPLGSFRRGGRAARDWPTARSRPP
jgi:hypothetical protein